MGCIFLLECTGQYSTILDNMVQYWAIQYSTGQYGTVLDDTVQYWTV